MRDEYRAVHPQAIGSVSFTPVNLQYVELLEFWFANKLAISEKITRFYVAAPTLEMLHLVKRNHRPGQSAFLENCNHLPGTCLLYTSDAADE